MRRLLGGLGAVIATGVPASADFTIRAARIAAGDLWVVGEVDEPNTLVTLDETYTETTDSRGRFQFRTAYHPATCTVILKTQRQSRAVVVANCGQRGPAWAEGRPGPAEAPPPARAVEARQSPAGEAAVAPVQGGAPMPPTPSESEPSSDVSCDQKAALYAAANGFRLWVTRMGTLHQVNSLRSPPAQPAVFLQVSINGNPASLHGADYESLLRGGPPEAYAAANLGSITWAGKIERLPRTLQIVSEGGAGTIARLAFKECGSAPRANVSSGPKPGAGSEPRNARANPHPAQPLPQGALPEGAP